MRAVLLLLVCTSSVAIAVADDGWRYRARKDTTTQSDDKIVVPPDPPLPTFRKAVTLYMLVVDADATPHCDGRTIDPTTHTLGTSRYASSGTYLELGDGCSWMNVAEAAEGVSVDGAMWFRDRDACTKAIATHRPVATDLDGCIAEPPLREGAGMRAAIDRMFTRGGSIYTIVDDDTGVPRCDRIDVRHDRMQHTRMSRDARGKPLRGVTTWRFTYAVGEPTMTISDPSTEWSDGGGFGTPCAHDQTIVLGPDWVELGAKYYLSAASCRAAIATERKRASWFPTHGHAPEAPTNESAKVSHDTMPDFGGC